MKRPRRYMQSWEEFIKRAVMGELEDRQVASLITEAGEEVRNGAAMVFPMCIWVARAV